LFARHRSGDVSNEGRSLRSSPRAGEPRTWRREAADAYASNAAGESYVCGIAARHELAPERAKKAVRAKPKLREQHLWRARCIAKGARRVRKGAPGNRRGASLARRRAPPYLRDDPRVAGDPLRCSW